MNTLTIEAPAKVNLVLKVHGKKDDGFHDIETVFERVSICDRINISIEEHDKGIEISCTEPRVPLDESNICHKAAKKFLEKAKKQDGVKIHIEKNIPVAAGMAGGSTDAAAVLKGLQTLYDGVLEYPEILAIANEIGSDVAFFLHNNSFAVGTGRGNIIKPIETKKTFYHLIICPDKQVLAKEVYQRYEKNSLNLTRKVCVDTIFRPEKGKDHGLAEQDVFFNDLQGSVIEIEPVVKEIMKVLYEIGAFKAMVSGSGPSVFGLFETKEKALKAKEQCCDRLSVTNQWYISEAETY